MRKLHEVALFADLSSEAIAALSKDARPRLFRAGDVVLRRGAEGQALFVVASGAVNVHIPETGRLITLGPGEVLGEMSLTSGFPVSATVKAVKDSHIYVVPKERFLALLDAEPMLRDALARLLIERLRRRESGPRQHGECIFVGMPSAPGPGRSLPRALARGVEHYAPGSTYLEVLSADAIHQLEADVKAWRDGATERDVLIVAMDPAGLQTARAVAEKGDTAIAIDDGSGGALDGTGVIGEWGLADYEVVHIGREPAASDAAARWRFRVSEDEIQTAGRERGWDPRSYATIDRVVRWMTRREVGIALGAGAARGFAHLGVLKALEDAGTPIDCLTGSSIGGIVALLFAMTGSADGAMALAEDTIGRNDLIRDVRWLPKESFLAGRKVRENAERITSGMSFADLQRPVSVVATDLVRGDRFVLERGSVATALVATATIPGVLPPVAVDDRMLVDGALTSRIPVDLLDRRRCGLKIAVNVVPSPVESSNAERDARDMRGSFDRLFGLRRVIARSWEVLGWWHGTADAVGADHLIEPCTDRYSGYDFATLPQMVAAGRSAAEEQIPALSSAVDALLRPVAT